MREISEARRGMRAGRQNSPGAKVGLGWDRSTRQGSWPGRVNPCTFTDREPPFGAPAAKPARVQAGAASGNATGGGGTGFLHHRTTIPPRPPATATPLSGPAHLRGQGDLPPSGPPQGAPRAPRSSRHPPAVRPAPRATLRIDHPIAWPAPPPQNPTASGGKVAPGTVAPRTERILKKQTVPLIFNLFVSECFILNLSFCLILFHFPDNSNLSFYNIPKILRIPLWHISCSTNLDL